MSEAAVQSIDSSQRSPSLRICPVETRRDERQFLELPWTLYESDPNWIPPLRQNQKEMVNYRSHPLYDENRIQTFLATMNGAPVGRIAAIIKKIRLPAVRERG